MNHEPGGCDGSSGQVEAARGPLVTPVAGSGAAGSHRGFLPWLAVLAYGFGVLWREWYILGVHQPREYIYSDMANYCDFARRIAAGGYEQTAYDTVQPQGNGFYLSWWYQLSGDWSWATGASLVLCALLPVVIWWLARMLCGARTAWCALLLSSCYFPFIDYGGYFLAETPFTLLLVLGTALLVHAWRQRRVMAGVAWGLAAGTAFGLAADFKTHGALVAVVLLAIAMGSALRRRSLRAAMMPLAAGLALTMSVLPMAMRATVLTGHPTLISTNGPLSALIGHYDPAIATFRFIDRQGVLTHWACPSTRQKGAHGTLLLHYPCYDGASCLATSWGWVRQHPTDAFILSCDHVLDLYAGRTYPWPSYSTSWRLWTMVWEKLALLLVTVPALATVVVVLSGDARRSRRVMLFLLSPILVLWITVFLSSGEPRYRIPFDAYAVIIAAGGYVRLLARCTRSATPAARTGPGTRVARPDGAASGHAGAATVSTAAEATTPA